MNSNNVQGPPPAGPLPQNHNGPPGPNLHMPAPDLRTMEELCQPTMNGRGGPIAPERYKLLIDRCPNHNMLPVTQIDTFYNGLTLRHRDTINAAAGGTFMKRRPEECYDLIENMTAHHNDWDTSSQRVLPLPPFYSSKEVERDPKTIMDQVPIESTIRVPPPVVQSHPAPVSSEIPHPPTPSSSELPKRNPHQPSIPYP
nr:reverse transcriptase domain-containing protein [Tanacetum cinerariifolium]